MSSVRHVQGSYLRVVVVSPAGRGRRFRRPSSTQLSTILYTACECWTTRHDGPGHRERGSASGEEWHVRGVSSSRWRQWVPPHGQVESDQGGRGGSLWRMPTGTSTGTWCRRVREPVPHPVKDHSTTLVDPRRKARVRRDRADAAMSAPWSKCWLEQGGRVGKSNAWGIGASSRHRVR